MAAPKEMEALVTDSDRDQNFYRSNAVSEVAMLFSVVKMLKRLPRIRRWSRIAIFSKDERMEAVRT